MVLGIKRLLLFVLLLFMIASCSDSDEKDKQSAIDKATEKIAREAVSSIKTPIDKANNAKELMEKKARAAEETFEQID